MSSTSFIPQVSSHLSSHRRSRPLLSLLLLAGLTMTSATHAAIDTDEDTDKEWKEVVLQLPDAPKAENLIPFYNSTTQSFAIDTQSLTVATDGTIRYTLVATSSSGAKNISYEAIRCQSYEKKLYAFGRPDGSWSRSRKDQWETISNGGINKQHGTLVTEYFCDGNSIAGKASVLIDRLRGKRTIFVR